MKRFLITSLLSVCALVLPTPGCASVRPSDAPTTQPQPQQASTMRAGWEFIATGVEVARFAGEVDDDAYAMFHAINPFVRRIIDSSESGVPIDLASLTIQVREALQKANAKP